MEREGLKRGYDAMNHSTVGGSLNNISHTYTHTHTHTHTHTQVQTCAHSPSHTLTQVEISHFQYLWVNYELVTCQDQGQQNCFLKVETIWNSKDLSFAARLPS